MEPAAPLTVPEVMSRAVPAAPPAVRTPFLSIVVVNYRQWRNTARLTRQLLGQKVGQGGAAEVVILDNYSPAHPWRRRLRRMSGVSLRCWGRNRGFARGVNEGCRLSRGEWFLLLNPDVTVAAGFLESVLDYARRIQAADPKAGVIGFQVRDRDGKLQPSAGGFPTFFGTLLGVLRKRSARKCRIVPGRKPKRVPWVTGCCLLVHRDCFEQLGGFDRDFFLYYEDVDFCRRATNAGWSVWHEPSLFVTHHHPLHTRSVPPRLRLLTRHSLMVYARKHWPLWQFQALAAVVRIEAAARRCWEKLRKRRRNANIFRRLGRIATDMFLGRMDRAQARLVRIVGPSGGKIRRTEGRAKSPTSSAECRS